MVLPRPIINAFDLTKENYVKSDLKISVVVGNMKVEKLFNRVFCSECEKNSLPLLLDKYDGVSTLKELVRNWDDLKVPSTCICIVGCFIDLQPEVFAGPSKRKFLEVPSEHFHGACLDLQKQSALKKLDLKGMSKIQTALSKLPKQMMLQKPSPENSPWHKI